MEKKGELYFQKAVYDFERNQYEDAVKNWIQAYELGYAREVVMKNLYDCFVIPNESEFRENYTQSSTGYKKPDYEACTLDFIPVSDARFYIFDRETDSFQGVFELEDVPVRGKKEVFDSILFADIWDIREMIPDMKENNRETVYLLLNDMEKKFASFFKLPHFSELYLRNTAIFPNEEIMRFFFEKYEEFYLPKQFAAPGAEKYAGWMRGLHQKRIHHRNASRTQIFLSICFPKKLEKADQLKIKAYLQRCPYDSEIEVLIAGEEEAGDAKDARLRYFRYAKEHSYAFNVRKSLQLAKGRFQVIADADDCMIWDQIGENLNFIQAHAGCSLFGVEGKELVVREEEQILPDTDWLHDLLFQAVSEQRRLFECLRLQQQYHTKCFHQGIWMDIAEEWTLASGLISGMQQLLEIDGVTKIPAGERDPNLIVMAITQLLNPKHAPTRILLELCRILELYMNKKVFLLSEILETTAEQSAQMGIRKFFKLNFNESLTGSFEYAFMECKFSGYQILLKQENVQEMKQLMARLYDARPYCVWCIGGTPVFAAAMKQFTTVIYTKCVEGYSGIPADMAVNYFERAQMLYPKEKEFLTRRGVEVQDIRLGLSSYHRSKGIYKRSDFSIPEEAFCIGIAGNRLEDDCTGRFLQILGSAMQREASREIWLVFIGRADRAFREKAAAQTGAASRIRFLGHCEEFADAVALVDVLAASPGLGNGGSGVTALQEGKPVITLETGDIASCTGKEFQCRTLEEYPDLIHRYIEDSEFYDRQSRRAAEIFQGLQVDDASVAAQIHKILEQVKGN